MHRVLLMSVLSLAISMPTGVCLAQGGLFARLNKPLVPSTRTVPGVPTASPLGLIAPRLSNAVSMFQLGGMGTQASRRGASAPLITSATATIKGPPGPLAQSPAAPVVSRSRCSFLARNSTTTSLRFATS